jgi:hypothetical protein
MSGKLDYIEKMKKIRGSHTPLRDDIPILISSDADFTLGYILPD